MIAHYNLYLDGVYHSSTQATRTHLRVAPGLHQVQVTAVARPPQKGRESPLSWPVRVVVPG